MSEDFCSAFMLRGNISISTNLKNVFGVGCYSVNIGNPTAPDGAAGVLLVLPPASRPKLKFIKENDWNVYTLVDDAWQSLGTAATYDITTSDKDLTPGHVLKTGDAGIMTAHVISHDQGDVAMQIMDEYWSYHFMQVSEPVEVWGTDVIPFTAPFSVFRCQDGQYGKVACIGISLNKEIAFAVANHPEDGEGYIGGSFISIYTTENPPPPPNLSAYETVADANARFITGYRMANYASNGSEGLYDSEQRVMTGIYAANGWDNPSTQESRQAQFQINGNWYNAAYV